VVSRFIGDKIMPPYVWYALLACAFMASVTLLLFFIWVSVIFICAGNNVQKDPYLEEVDKLVDKAKKFNTASSSVVEDRFEKLSGELNQITKEMERSSAEFQREMENIMSPIKTRKRNKNPK
jgi:esterase/lipase